MATAIPLPARLALLLLLAVALLFWPAIDFDFLNYDDDLHVYENHLVTQFNPTILKQIWTDSFQGLYIPLTYTIWGGLGRLSAWLHPSTNPTILDPAVFHSANIVLHAGAVLVVFAILRLLLNREWPAAAGALLFALHPVQVSPVAWVSEMKGVLAGLLGLLAIWHYLRYSLTPPAAIHRRRLRYLAAIGCFLAAILAKPSVTSVPLIAAILAILPLQRDWRQVARELAPWLLLAVPIILVTKGDQPSEELLFTPNLWQRILVAGDAITFYHSKLLWPFRLGPDYGRDPEQVLASGWVYLTGLLPYAIAAVLIWRVRRPWLITGGLVFVAALLPVLGFIPFMFQAISTVANRYLYLAMLAPALLLARLLCLYPGRRAAALAACLLLLLAMRSSVRLQYWQNSLTFNQRAVEINPESWLAYNNLGAAFKKRGRIQEAMAAFREAIEHAPGHTPAYANLGTLYAETGQIEEAKACYLKAIELRPFSPRVYLLLGVLASRNGQPLEAFGYYQQALELEPRFASAHGYIGLLYTQLKQFEEAIASYRRAIELDPYLAPAYNNLGTLYEMTGRREEAVAAYRQYIYLNPGHSEGYNNLGRLLIDAGRAEEAVPLLQQAVALAPEQPLPANNLGLAYLKLGRIGEAKEWLRRALAIDPGFALARKNLASAEALEKSRPASGAAAGVPDKITGMGLSR